MPKDKEKNVKILPFPKTEEGVRQALLDNKKCCMDARPIHHMAILKIKSMSSHRYIFQAVVERREYLLRTRPYFGGPVNRPEKLPSKWNVTAQSPKGTQEASQEIDFPSTEDIQTCGNCEGAGIFPCYRCGGSGRVRDMSTSSHTRSVGAFGDYRTCPLCWGSGSTKCPQCEGMQKVVAWSYLNVTWKIETRTYNTETGQLPDKVLEEARYAKAEVNQASTAGHIHPIKYREDPTITAIAKKFVQEALVEEDWKISSANQSVVTIPVIEVKYEYKGRKGHFYVLGEQRLTYFPSGYPGADCKCGCFCCSCCPDCCCVIV